MPETLGPGRELHHGNGNPLPAVVLSQNVFSKSAWQYLCHKFGIETAPEFVRKLKVQSGADMDHDELDVSYIWHY